MIAAIDIPPKASARLAAALSSERRRVLALGLDWPQELDALMTIVNRPARSGQLADTTGQSPHGDCDCSEHHLVSIRGAAAALGVSERTLRRLRSNGSLPTVQVGRRQLVRRSDLTDFIEQREG